MVYSLRGHPHTPRYTLSDQHLATSLRPKMHYITLLFHCPKLSHTANIIVFVTKALLCGVYPPKVLYSSTLSLYSEIFKAQNFHEWLSNHNFTKN